MHCHLRELRSVNQKNYLWIESETTGVEKKILADGQKEKYQWMAI